MTISAFTIDSLKEFITGDSGCTPKLTGPKLVELFNQFGFRDVYEWGKGGLPNSLPRNYYARDRVTELNGKKELKSLLHYIVDARHFSQFPNLDRDKAVQKINELIAPDGYRYENIDGVWKIIGAEVPDVIEVEVHFEEIQGQIIEQLRGASFTIWVAVAWFTDDLIFNELVRKAKDGINVQLIVFDDEINRNNGFEYENYFETYRIKPIGTFKNIMHHKFCVIDLKTVLHGSYNWTRKARWNKETVSIDVGRELAEKFSAEFIKIKTEANPSSCCTTT